MGWVLLVVWRHVVVPVLLLVSEVWRASHKLPLIILPHRIHIVGRIVSLPEVLRREVVWRVHTLRGVEPIVIARSIH